MQDANRNLLAVFRSQDTACTAARRQRLLSTEQFLAVAQVSVKEARPLDFISYTGTVGRSKGYILPCCGKARIAASKTGVPTLSFYLQPLQPQISGHSQLFRGCFGPKSAVGWFCRSIFPSEGLYSEATMGSSGSKAQEASGCPHLRL